MDRSLQSALDKRNRVGAWQSRVYRLERGYLSTWPDVAAAARKDEPSKTECLWQDGQVAALTDQGERRFRIEFPWVQDTNSKILQLRASDVSMKKAWTDLLRTTIKEATSQIEGTGSVFAYGGSAQHEVDQAYEEAAYLKTNRFLAAYVVDEQHRASYVNDHLNESFQDEGELGPGQGGALRACSGANAAINELLALISDFKAEMQGVEELRQGSADNNLGGLDPSVAAPKIRRFCEEHLALTGRSVASRLMLELAPFMDASVAGTSAAPTSSTRPAVVSTRRRLDEMYVAAERLVISGQRYWLMDIRGAFLDCSALESAKSAPPLPPSPELQTAPEPAAVMSADPDPGPSLASKDQCGATKRPSKMLLQVSSAVSAAKAATVRASSLKGNSAASNEKAPGNASGEMEQSASAAAPSTSIASRFSGIAASGLSMKAFRRGSRNETSDSTDHQLSPGRSPKASQRRTLLAAEQVDAAFAGNPHSASGGSGDQDTEERPSLSGSSSFHSSKNTRLDARLGEDASSSSRSQPTSVTADLSPASGAESPPPPAPTATAVPESTSGSARKGRRAFAGGLWTGGDSARKTSTPVGSSQTFEAVYPNVEAVSDQLQSTSPAASAASSFKDVDNKPRPSAAGGGGKRRFAGGGLGSGSASAVSSAFSTQRESNPFGGSNTAGGIDSSSVRVESRAQSHALRPPGTAPTPSWALGDDSHVPDWVQGGAAGSARFDSGGKAASSSGGIAPPSRPVTGQDAASKRSPFMAQDVEIPASKPNPQRMQRSGAGASGGSRRAFGGGQSLF